MQWKSSEMQFWVILGDWGDWLWWRVIEGDWGWSRVIKHDWGRLRVIANLSIIFLDPFVHFILLSNTLLSSIHQSHSLALPYFCGNMETQIPVVSTGSSNNIEEVVVLLQRKNLRKYQCEKWDGPSCQPGKLGRYCKVQTLHLVFLDNIWCFV